MTVTLHTPTVDGLGHVVGALREWQDDASPMQLHPGDLGWNWQFGATATAAALRTWSRDGQLVALGLLDSPELLRLTIAPQARRDAALAQLLVADIDDPQRGVLPGGTVSIEAPNDAVIQDVLSEVGWQTGEAWTPLRRDLTHPVTKPKLRIEVIGPQQAPAYAAVHRSAFGSTRFTDELWQAMTTGLPYRDARCLLGYDDGDDAVAEVTVWSAGPGRPGLLEPLGVHADFRGLGHGTAISLAAAAALQELGCSSALVCTPSANVTAIAAYESAGFQVGAQRLDRYRAA